MDKEVKTVDISLDTIIRECSLNKDLSFEHYIYFNLSNRELIHEIFKYKKFNNDFTNKISCYSTSSSIIGRIRPSYDYFLSELIKIMNLKYDGGDDELLTKRLLERLDILTNIKNEKELKKEFPLLYKDLIDGRKYYNGLISLYSINGEYEVQSKEHYYYSCGLKKNLKNFVKTQSVMYKRYICDRKKLKEKQENFSFNPYLRKYFDKDKLMLYIIDKYISYCETSSEQAKIRYIMNKIEMYIKSYDYSKYYVIYNDNNEKVDINSINHRYNLLNEKLSDKNVGWILIPKGKTLSKVRKRGKERTLFMSTKDIELLKKVGEAKEVFYESSNYIAKVVGLGKYKGYVGYIYENGEVILDMQYDSKKPKTAKGNAAYNMAVDDFEELSKKNKQQLINNPKVKRICHKNNWTDQIRPIIERKATEEEKNKTKELIKRLKRKP